MKTNGASVSANGTEPVRDALVAKHLPEYIDDRAPGSYFISSTSRQELMSWQYICDVLSHGDLDQLFRDPVCDTAYREFAPAVRSKYNGMENYIRQVRLGWPTEESTGVAVPSVFDRPPKDPLSVLASGSASGVSTPNGTKLPVEAVKETWPEKVLPHPTRPGIVLRHFVADAEKDGEGGESLIKVIPNDWPYGIPPGSTHWVAWSKLSILHPSLFSTPDTPFDSSMTEELYNCVTSDGIRGFTGFSPEPTYEWQGRTIPEILGAYSQAKLDEGTAGLSKELISQAHAWASRHVTEYIEAKWPKDKYQTAWFCNPPLLRTVPGLSHFQ